MGLGLGPLGQGRAGVGRQARCCRIEDLGDPRARLAYHIQCNTGAALTQLGGIRILQGACTALWAGLESPAWMLGAVCHWPVSYSLGHHHQIASTVGGTCSAMTNAAPMQVIYGQVKVYATLPCHPGHLSVPKSTEPVIRYEPVQYSLSKRSLCCTVKMTTTIITQQKFGVQG